MPKRRANGEGSLYKRADGIWCAQYTDFTGKKRYLYGKTQQVVKEKLKEAIQQNDSGIVVETKKISFAAWIKEWLEVYQKPFIRQSTYYKSLGKWENHIKEYWGNIQLKDVREETLQKYLNMKLEKRIDGKSGGYSTGVCIELKGLLYGALEKAVDLGYLPRNPAKKLKIPNRSFKKKQVFNLEQQRAFEKYVKAEMESNHNHSVFLLMLYTGLRAGEALGLQKRDIDFTKKELHINRTVSLVQEAEEGGVVFYSRDPKTTSSKRTLPITPIVEELLQSQIEYRNRVVDALRERWEGRGQDLTCVDDGYLFITIQGNTLNQSNLNKKMNQITKALDLPHTSMHGLRHAFATRWMEAGLDVKSLSEILGHADVKMTLNIYTHSLPEQKRKNMDAMAKVFVQSIEKD